MIVLTLFPLTYPFLVCVPWVVARCFVSRWAGGRALLLLGLMGALFELKPDGEERLLQRAGMHAYVEGFSLVLGVYVFGAQGVLFGPMLVCAAKLLYELGGSIIQQAEGLGTPPPASPPPANAAAPDGAPPIAAQPSVEALLRTMRRLSFWSSPRMSRNAPTEPPSLSARPAAPGTATRRPGPLAPPTPAPAGTSCVPVSTGLGGAVRVAVPPPSCDWEAFLQLVTERLAAALGLVGEPAPCIGGLADGQGLVLGHVADLVPGETLYVVRELNAVPLGEYGDGSAGTPPETRSEGAVDGPADIAVEGVPRTTTWPLPSSRLATPQYSPQPRALGTPAVGSAVGSSAPTAEHGSVRRAARRVETLAEG